MTNSVIETILKRRSTRKYKPEQINDEELEQILQAGRYAPSGGNSQSTTFMVIQNQNVLNELALLVEGEFAKMEVYDGMYRSLKSSIQSSKKGGYRFHYNAPTLIVTSNLKDYGNAMADCAVAIENMMLAATSLHIGSCWINQLKWLDENPNVRAFLQKYGLGCDETICGAVALGYSDHISTASPRTGNVAIYVR